MGAALGPPAAMTENHDVLDALLAGAEPADPREELLKELADHQSLKTDDTLTNEDATRAAVGRCEYPFACPYGRPTVLRIDEKTFTRVFERPNTRFE